MTPHPTLLPIKVGKERTSRPATTPKFTDNENIRINCQLHNCERCVPIGKRGKDPSGGVPMTPLSELQEFVATNTCIGGIHKGWVPAINLDNWIAQKKMETE